MWIYCKTVVLDCTSFNLMYLINRKRLLYLLKKSSYNDFKVLTEPGLINRDNILISDDLSYLPCRPVCDPGFHCLGCCQIHLLQPCCPPIPHQPSLPPHEDALSPKHRQESENLKNTFTLSIPRKNINEHLAEISSLHLWVFCNQTFAFLQYGNHLCIMWICSRN